MGHKIFVKQKWATKEKRLRTTVLELRKKLLCIISRLNKLYFEINYLTI